MHIFAGKVLDYTGSGLLCARPCYAADDCVVGEGAAERVFVADAVLDDDEGRGGRCEVFEKWWDAGGGDGFVGADDVVEGLGGFGGRGVDC